MSTPLSTRRSGKPVGAPYRPSGSAPFSLLRRSSTPSRPARIPVTANSTQASPHTRMLWLRTRTNSSALHVMEDEDQTRRIESLARLSVSVISVTGKKFTVTAKRTFCLDYATRAIEYMPLLSLSISKRKDRPSRQRCKTRLSMHLLPLTYHLCRIR